MGKGFFTRLFDFSFETFVTTSIIKALYIIFIIGAGLGALVLFVSLATQGGASLVLGLVLAPLIFLLYTILARVYMEILIVVFRIAEDIAAIAVNTKRE